MTLAFHITDTTTGETRVHHSDEAWDYLVEFDWGENNNSCDCNRGIHFEDAGGVLDDDDDEGLGCGDERFFVRIYDDSGVLLYEDKHVKRVRAMSETSGGPGR